MEDDPDHIPIYKMPGPFLVMLLVGLFFFGLFIGGFYWNEYVFPGIYGPDVISGPSKYLVMAAFLLFSAVVFSIMIPTCVRRCKRFLFLLILTGIILFTIGNILSSSAPI